MYTTSRKTKGSTIMICADCGHTISMNDLCEKPLQSATNMLKHMAAHNAARAFATAARVIGSGSAPTIVTSTFVSTFPAEQLPVEPVLAASLATTDIAMVADESRGEAAEPTA